MSWTEKSSRRTFLKTAAGAGLVSATELRARPLPQPRGRIGIATIGVGQQGFRNTRTALEIPGVELVGIADLYRGRRERAREVFGNSLVMTADHRELVSRKDVDAVIVATSDHWHAPICEEAMEAGKDVYCEKPMVQTIEQGHQLIEMEKKTGRILQVGSQRTSSPISHKARQLIRDGAIGEINFAEAWYRRSSTNGAWQYVIPPDASPATVDWKRFLGSAPPRPFDADRFFRWRSYWDYGTGIPGDLFVHMLTGLHYIIESNGPVRVYGEGGLRFWKDGREVPDMIMGAYEYAESDSHPAFTLILKVNFADVEQQSGFRFVGSEGVMDLGREIRVVRRPRPDDIRPSISTFPQALQSRLLEEHRRAHPEAHGLQTEESQQFTLAAGSRSQLFHFQRFFDSVQSREPVVQDATFGLRAAGPALATNTSFLEKRVVSWDPDGIAIGDGS